MFVPGINTQAYRLFGLTRCNRQLNSERRSPYHSSFFLFKQMSRFCRRTGHQWLSAFVQDNDKVPGVHLHHGLRQIKGSEESFQNSSFIQLVRRMLARSLTIDQPPNAVVRGSRAILSNLNGILSATIKFSIT